MKSVIPKPQRCAIYTRKSTEHNLDLAFNSLDAQREACEAYVKSQAHEKDICHEWDDDLVRDFLKDEALIGGFEQERRCGGIGRRMRSVPGGCRVHQLAQAAQRIYLRQPHAGVGATTKRHARYGGVADGLTI